jgi:hypothetical protein
VTKWSDEKSHTPAVEIFHSHPPGARRMCINGPKITGSGLHKHARGENGSAPTDLINILSQNILYSTDFKHPIGHPRVRFETCA